MSTLGTRPRTLILYYVIIVIHCTADLTEGYREHTHESHHHQEGAESKNCSGRVRRKSVFVDIWVGWLVHLSFRKDSRFNSNHDTYCDSGQFHYCDTLSTSDDDNPSESTGRNSYTIYRHILGVRGRTMGSRVSNIIIVLSVDSGSTWIGPGGHNK